DRSETGLPGHPPRDRGRPVPAGPHRVVQAGRLPDYPHARPVLGKEVGQAGAEAPRRCQGGVRHHGTEDQPPRPADWCRAELRRAMGSTKMTQATKHRYRPTEAKYKGRAEEMYVTYDLSQPTRGGRRAMYPKVHRVYIAGQVKDWHVGNFAKR